MVDWAKKIHKHSGSELYAGEQVEAGTFVQPTGTLGRQVGFGVGGVVGAVAAEKLAKKGDDVGAGGGIADSFPASRSVLGVSTQRLMVFAHGSVSGRSKEMVAHVPLRDVAGIAIEKKKMSFGLTIGFSDGSAIEYEAVKMAKPVEFVETFNRLRGAGR